MLRFILLCLFINVTFGEEDFKLVVLDEGGVKGNKYWNGDFYEFYGVPYATVPKGRDRFQAPLRPEPWNGVMTANIRGDRCFQAFLTAESDDPIVDGIEECLVMNLLVPKVADEKNLVPVLVYVHSGSFSGGNGNMAQFHYIARHDIIVISFNYRLGAVGFACLGNKEVPGNAGMKDQLAALKWINKNIAKFGGNPEKVTVAGFSVGAAMAELLTLSKTTDGLIDKIILDSGSALSPFTINRDPINTARNIAIAVGYKDTGSLRDLTEFYLNSSLETLTKKSQNFFLPNSTFGFAPCIENIHDGIEAFLTESPLDIIKDGRNKKVAVLTGFANMEGLSRSIKFNEWSEKMNEKFDDFLPADLKFDDEKSKENFINRVKELYFPHTIVDKQGYIDYFSDSMFKYSIMKSAKEHADKSKRPVYLYEFSYVGDLSVKHMFMDQIKGASHRDQTAYILDFFSFTNKKGALNMRDRMTSMWSDFVKYEDPTAFESSLVDYKWVPYTNQEPNYLQIGDKVKMDKDLFKDGYKFWNQVYEKHHWNPKAPRIEVEETKQETKDKINQKQDKPQELPIGESKTSDNKKPIHANDPKPTVKKEKDPAPETKDAPVKPKNERKKTEL